MKTKVFAVESIKDEQPYDPQTIKYKFRQKIDHRLSVMQNQKRRISRLQNVAAQKMSKPKGVSVLPDDNVTSAKLLLYVDSAMKLQQNAFEAAIATNQAYAMQLLLIYLESFVSFVFNCYYMISVIAEPSTFKLSRSESIAYLSQHLLQPCVCVIVTVVGFVLIQYQFRQSQGIVNKIIIYAEDADVRTRFLAFSQQLQSNIPRFSVYGFFSLDGSVIFNLASATTTYLIILVQTLGGERNENIVQQVNKANQSAAATNTYEIN